MIDFQTGCSWIIGVNGACLAAVSLWKVVYHVKHAHTHAEDIIPAGYHRAAYACGFMLAIILLVTVAVWDTAHPFEQFPYRIRMVFTIPMLILVDYAFIGRVWKKKSLQK